MFQQELVGTVISDQDTPTFETVRIKLKSGQDVRPGTLVRIPVSVNGANIALIGRIRSAYEHNPNETAEDINVRDTLGIGRNYPNEEDSTTIYRQVEADLIEEFADTEIRAPETLPRSGADVFVASSSEVVKALGTIEAEEDGLFLGETTGGIKTAIVLKKEIIQRHIFVCGTTGSGKSYAMGVIAEEIIKHGLPVIFLDTQDEYSTLVEKLGGKVLVPGQDFTIRISSLTEQELLELIPTDSDLQKNIIAAAFLELQDELKANTRSMFLLSDLVDRVRQVGTGLTNNRPSIALAATRTQFLERLDILGTGVDRANWPALMVPCLAIKCKHLTSRRLQTVATALLRELQDLRLRGYIPPYVAVIDEAHLFVPEGESSPCKQIIAEGVRIGRHHGISLILMTQSPVDIDKRAIRQCNTRLVFALEADQLDAIKGVKADASDEMLRSLPKMPRGTCILSGTYESIKHAIPVTIRLRKTLKSEGGETPKIFDEMRTQWSHLKQ